MSMFGGNSGGSGKSRGRPKKDPFDKISPEFRNKVESSSIDEINLIISDVAKESEATSAAMKADPEVVQLKEDLKLATADYKDTIKRCKQELAFCMEILAGKGGI